MKLGYVIKNLMKFEKYENMGENQKILKNHEKLIKLCQKSKNRKIHIFQYQLLLNEK